jgi:hypothetical protein
LSFLFSTHLTICQFESDDPALVRRYILAFADQLPRFHKTGSNTYEFRCIECGDSKRDAYRCRGYIYLRGGKWFYYCHNCNASTTFLRLLRRHDSFLFQQYLREKRSGTVIDTLLPPPPTVLEPEQERLERLRRMVARLVPLSGTPSEVYVRRHRKIDPPSDLPFPRSLYHDLYSCRDGTGGWLCGLVGLATDKDGKYFGALETRLKPNGEKDEKRTLGFGSLGAAVILRPPVNGWMAYGEGLETCLSVWVAVPEIGVAAVGDKNRFRHAPILSGTTKVLLLQDNDGIDGRGRDENWRGYRKAIGYFQERVGQVGKVKPIIPKTDFNDMLRNEGIEAVRNIICDAISKPKHRRTIDG